MLHVLFIIQQCSSLHVIQNRVIALYAVRDSSLCVVNYRDSLWQSILHYLGRYKVCCHILYRRIVEKAIDKGNIKGQDTCYSAAYMSQTRDQQRFYNLGSGS